MTCPLLSIKNADPDDGVTSFSFFMVVELLSLYSGYDFKSISQFIYDVKDLKNGEISINKLENIRPTFKESLVSTAVVDAVNQSLDNDSNWIQIDDLS